MSEAKSDPKAKLEEIRAKRAEPVAAETPEAVVAETPEAVVGNTLQDRLEAEQAAGREVVARGEKAAAAAQAAEKASYKASQSTKTTITDE